ncbi:ABC transporter permease [Streptomyces albidus (ex Kaewkla and Franco 2022)]|uniref:ABC transporter permease n=1 Tax=Streptomyces albidus (ex Kaewkla and Franco 2022) TaxID=722709 RepID=UPI0015EE7042|nr:ABC transporter permease [Streptomyces albidus (ex Kaewkla and Franco 2022)]
MTAPTEVSRLPDGSPGTPAPARRRGPHGLLWLTLRVHRASLWGWAAFAAVATGGLLWLYDIARTREQWDGCGGPGRPACPPVDEMRLFDLLSNMITFLPFAVAVYAAGVLVARDLENGTAALARTQSVSPARWLAAKLAVPGVLIMAITAVMSLIFRQAWSFGTQQAFHPWHFDAVFHSAGVISLAHVVLGLAVGALAGLLAKRTLPAMGLAFAAFLPVHLAFNSLRYDLWPRVGATGFDAARIHSDPVLGEMGFVKDGGARVQDSSCYGVASPADLQKCLDVHGARDLYLEFHPSSHFWPIQLVETGIVLALAAVVLWAAFRLLGTGNATPTSRQEAAA